MAQPPISFRDYWLGFDLQQLSSDRKAAPTINHYHGRMAILEGCISTTDPQKLGQPGWFGNIGNVSSPPQTDVNFLSPSAAARFLGNHQMGTSMKVTKEGQIQIYFSKTSKPMVLHISGLCYPVLDMNRMSILPISSIGDSEEKRGVEVGKKRNLLTACPDNPPCFCRCGDIVCLMGELLEYTFREENIIIARMPQEMRPLREVRWLANLMKEEPNQENEGSLPGPFIFQSVMLTIRPNGDVVVHGGKMHINDGKGTVKIVHQNKKGCLSLDGIRYSLSEHGEPVSLSPHLADRSKHQEAGSKHKLSNLLPKSSSTATVVRDGNVIMLEGLLKWDEKLKHQSRQPIATLPEGFGPRTRLVFYTRGSTEIEERRRVDVDRYGRIFCPEASANGEVELTGIIYAAANNPHAVPRPSHPDLDELSVAQGQMVVEVVSANMGGSVLLEPFLKRLNWREWKHLEFNFRNSGHQRMHFPFSTSFLRGHLQSNPQNISKEHNIFERYYANRPKSLKNDFGIESFHVLLHLSDGMFAKVANKIGMTRDDMRYMTNRRSQHRELLARKRAPGLGLAAIRTIGNQIIDEMFQLWDFRAQVERGLKQDFLPPESIKHLFPVRESKTLRELRRNLGADSENMKKYAEIQQFFLNHQSEGKLMTHSSFMGARDPFTSTGRWYFPDEKHLQQRLFESIAWLYEIKEHVYISECQTHRFPFIEDLDLMCRSDYFEPPRYPEGTQPHAPDDVLITPPQRTGDKVTGDPGEFMRKRAYAVHRIYPQFGKLDVIVYSSSGFHKGKGMYKTSFHLLWPELIVDPDVAPEIRKVTLEKFKRESKDPSSSLHVLEKELVAMVFDKSTGKNDEKEENDWDHVFDKTTENARNGLRLPYSDKVSETFVYPEERQLFKEGKILKKQATLRKEIEGRINKAIGRIRFSFDGHSVTGEWIEDAQSHSVAEWIQMGTCRRSPDDPEATLTPWHIDDEIAEILKREGTKLQKSAGGSWVTHKPFDNIRRYYNENTTFEEAFDEELERWQHEVTVRGRWASGTPNQAIWRTFPTYFPSRHAHAKKHWRPTEVIYVKKDGKVIIDGPPHQVQELLELVKPLTEADDQRLQPI